ncbi:unnamed protein product [Soboliphyme baturini]|uniref:TGF_BETA_2 domain-containing protein n=1 Tax=Soboliphyme baturini TaxID=241478 RepID=A0A183IU90_9BILA|nr:unnamed protein product [Soboliphyme baturini]
MVTACCASPLPNRTDPEGTRVSWERQIRSLDNIHRLMIKQRIVDSMHLRDLIDGVKRPPKLRASTVKALQADLPASTEVGEDVSRKYVLRIVASKQGSAPNYNWRTMVKDGEDANSSRLQVLHYSFNMSSLAKRYGIHLTEATIETSTKPSAYVLYVDNATYYGNCSRGNPECVVSSNGQEIRVQVKATQHLAKRWFSGRNIEAFITLLVRDANCNRPQSRHCRKNLQTSPVLKLSLTETNSLSSRDKRQALPNMTMMAGNIATDCDTQWDEQFLKSMNTGIYDSLMPCCRRRLRITFDDFGWGDWAYAPRSFDSYYCIGRCSHFGGFASSKTEGYAYYAEIMNWYRDAKTAALSPCCSPVKFSPLTISVMQGPNEQVTQTLENVIVKQCGCL